MKIALAQQDYHIGNFKQNTSKIITSILEAKALGVDLIIFPELCISGYPPRDFLEYDHFIDECNNSVREIAEHCNGIAAIVGSPVRNPNNSGKLLYNAALFLAEGEIAFEYDKALLPDYDVFDEYRYFEPGKKFDVFKYKGKSLSLKLCSMFWRASSLTLWRNRPKAR